MKLVEEISNQRVQQSYTRGRKRFRLPFIARQLLAEWLESQWSTKCRPNSELVYKIAGCINIRSQVCSMFTGGFLRSKSRCSVASTHVVHRSGVYHLFLVSAVLLSRSSASGAQIHRPLTFGPTNSWFNSYSRYVVSVRILLTRVEFRANFAYPVSV